MDAAELNRVAETATNIANEIAISRWGAIAQHLQTRWRDPWTHGTAELVREPLAPGFRPRDGELFASTYFEVDIGRPDAPDACTAGADAAAYRLEEQVRQQLRDRRGAPAAIALEPGERLCVVPMPGAERSPIRVRMSRVDPTSSVMRFDLELFLRRATVAEMQAGLSRRLLVQVQPIVSKSIDMAGASNPVLSQVGNVRGVPVTVVVGIGEAAASKLAEAGQMLRDHLRDEGGGAAP